MTNILQAPVATPETAKMVVLAGLVGGLLSMRFVDGMNCRERLFAIISGMVLAHYLAPPIAYLWAEGQYEETIGFLIGLFGMSICSAVFRSIRKADLWALVSKRFSREEL